MEYRVSRTTGNDEKDRDRKREKEREKNGPHLLVAISTATKIFLTETTRRDATNIVSLLLATAQRGKSRKQEARNPQQRAATTAGPPSAPRSWNKSLSSVVPNFVLIPALATRSNCHSDSRETSAFPDEEKPCCGEKRTNCAYQLRRRVYPLE